MQSSISTNKIHSFQLPRKILFGVKASEKVGLEVKALGGKEVFLVTDQNLVKSDIFPKIEDTLVNEGLHVDVYSDVEPEPHLEVAEAIAEASRRVKSDVVVGVGGGSVLDMAKVAAMAATNPGPMRRYVGTDLVREPGLPSVLLPTTAGTGSEVTNVAVVTIVEDELKTAIISPNMFAATAIVDPSLTYTMPPRLTASTGLDALSHGFEALMSINSNPITDSLALESIKLIFYRLADAYRNGDAGSRYGMSLGSLVAGMAFGNAGVCLGHASAYAFAVSYRVAHGTSCGLVLPHVFRFNASAISWKLLHIAEAMHLDAKDLQAEEVTFSIAEAIIELMGKLHAPTRLRDLEVPNEAVPKIADKLITFKRLIQRNPRPLSKEDALKLVEGMW